MRTGFSITLPAPREALFLILSDPRQRLRWQSSLVSLEMTSEGEPRAGTTWREEARGFGAFEMEITECVAGRSWAERGRSRRGEIDLRLVFADGRAPDTTQLDLAVELRLAPPWSLVARFAPPILRPLMKRDLQRAAQLARAAG